mgnify:CR=1 FL=1
MRKYFFLLFVMPIILIAQESKIKTSNYDDEQKLVKSGTVALVR